MTKISFLKTKKKNKKVSYFAWERSSRITVEANTMDKKNCHDSDFIQTEQNTKMPLICLFEEEKIETIARLGSLSYFFCSDSSVVVEFYLFLYFLTKVFGTNYITSDAIVALLKLPNNQKMDSFTVLGFTICIGQWQIQPKHVIIDKNGHLIDFEAFWDSKCLIF